MRKVIIVIVFGILFMTVTRTAMGNEIDNKVIWTKNTTMQQMYETKSKLVENAKIREQVIEYLIYFEGQKCMSQKDILNRVEVIGVNVVNYATYLLINNEVEEVDIADLMIKVMKEDMENYDK